MNPHQKGVVWLERVRGARQTLSPLGNSSYQTQWTCQGDRTLSIGISIRRIIWIWAVFRISWDWWESIFKPAVLHEDYDVSFMWLVSKGLTYLYIWGCWERWICVGLRARAPAMRREYFLIWSCTSDIVWAEKNFCTTVINRWFEKQRHDPWIRAA